MKNYKKNSNRLVSIFLVASVLLLITVVVPVSFGAVVDEYRVQVPLVIDLSYVVAGVQFTFEYSVGLEFVSYEKSAAISSALFTPVVVKDGYTHLGFYNSDNRYAPENGKLNMGYLVFICSNDDPQQVTLTEIKLVQVDANGNTHSEFIAPAEIKISPEHNTENSSTNSSNDNGDGGGSSSSVGAKSSSGDGGGSSSSVGAKDALMDNSENSWMSIGFWIALTLLFVVVCGAGILIIMKKRANIK